MLILERKKKCGCISLISPVIIACLLISTAFLAWQLHNRITIKTESSLEEIEKVCISPECAKAAGEMLQGIDSLVNPCEDFYTFACGKWEELHPIPDYFSSWNQFSILEDKLNRKIKGILENNLNQNDPQAVHLSKSFYNSCMWQDTEASQISLYSLIQEEINVGENNVSWSTKLGEMRGKIGTSVILSLYIALDQENSTEYAIHIDSPVLGLAKRYLLDRENINRQVYKTFIEEVWAELFTSEEEEAQRVAEELIEFETRLASIMGEGDKDPHYLYNPMTLQKLQDLIGNYTGLVWEEYVWEVFANSPIDLGPLSDLRVIVKDILYYKQLGNVLRDTNTTIIINYLKWGVVLDMRNFLSGRLRDLYIDFINKTEDSKEIYIKGRWRGCAFSTNAYFGMAISYKYVKDVFTGDFEKQMSEMIGNIQKSFIATIETAEWIGGHETRKRAKVKAEAMKKYVGFPNWLLTNSTALDIYYQNLNFTQPKSYFWNIVDLYYWLNLQELNLLGDVKASDKWITDPTQVNAFYFFGDNSITFPAAILQVPFYFTGRPIQALNYGAIGAVIGHEIIHGFDDHGRQIDEQGNLANWWDETTVFEYVTRAECFVEQYSQYEYTAQGFNITKVNGLQTLGENIADNGGLRQAFRAYESYIEEHGEEPHLPGLGYSPQQLFFLAYAQTWCGVNSEEGIREELLFGVHTTSQFRVKGVLQNSLDFAKAWNCLIPGEKEVCRIW